MSTQTDAAANNDPNIDDYHVNVDVKGTENDTDGPKSVDVTVQDPPKDTNVEVDANIDSDGNTNVKVKFTPNSANGKSQETPKEQEQEKEKETKEKEKEKETKEKEKEKETKEKEKETPKEQEKGRSPETENKTPPEDGQAPNSNEDSIPKSNYNEGDAVDSKLLDKLAEAGGKKNPDGSVTVNGKTVKPGDKLDQDTKVLIDAHDIERDEVATGDYRKGHKITPYMEQQLKDKGFTKDPDDKSYKSDDGKVIDADGDGKLNADDAEILKNGGVPKTSGYDRSDPFNPFQNDITQDMPSTTAEKTGYPGKTDGPNPPQIGGSGTDKGVNNKNPNVQAVYEYNEKTGSYDAVGEIWYDKTTDKSKYYEYGEEQKKKVNDHQVFIGDEKAWPKKTT